MNWKEKDYISFSEFAKEKDKVEGRALFLRLKYEKQLKENPELQTRLNEIEKISNPEEKAKQAQKVEAELAHTTVKQNNLE